jgi:hypothetical protein
MKPTPDDGSRKHAKLLDKAVLWGMIITVLFLTAFVIYSWYWFEKHPL